MIAVVIPSYKVVKHILQVISSIGPEVQKIYVVDDCCPQNSGKFVKENCRDPRVSVLFNEKNQGVGGAVIHGYAEALRDGCTIVIKIDGDGQMDCRQIPSLIKPIETGVADYSKGNRFYDVDSLRPMPVVRLLGNAGLTFINKLVSGYWTLFDPTNGFTAIHRQALVRLPFEKIAKRYFFESDMLFRLGIIRAVVVDVPMPSIYGSEESSLRVGKVLFEFPPKFFVRFLKRLFYRYVVRDFSLGTIYLFGGISFLSGGLVYGLKHFIYNYVHQITAPSGVVMLSALPIIIGFQMILSFLSFDLLSEPKIPLQNLIQNPTDKPGLHNVRAG